MTKTDYAAAMKKAAKTGDKKAYYKAQRQRAEKTGDTKTLDKIYSKIGNQTGKAKGDAKRPASMSKVTSPVSKKSTSEADMAKANAKREAGAKAGGISLPKFDFSSGRKATPRNTQVDNSREAAVSKRSAGLEQAASQRRRG